MAQIGVSGEVLKKFQDSWKSEGAAAVESIKIRLEKPVLLFSYIIMTLWFVLVSQHSSAMKVSEYALIILSSCEWNQVSKSK